MAFESEPLTYFGFGLPSTIVYLIGNVFTQYPLIIFICFICILIYVGKGNNLAFC